MCIRDRVYTDSCLWQIYRPLNNKAVDRLFIYLRTRFGSYGMKKNDTVRDMMTLKKEGNNNIVIFIADQTPSKANLHYWTTFLNQDTAMLNGAEPVSYTHLDVYKRQASDTVPVILLRFLST